MREKHKNVEQEKLGQEARVMGNKHSVWLHVWQTDLLEPEETYISFPDEEPWNPSTAYHK